MTSPAIAMSVPVQSPASPKPSNSSNPFYYEISSPQNLAAVSSLLNAANLKDSRWLTLEVCRQYQRSACTRDENECKFAHPPPHVDIQYGRVTCCYDSIKRFTKIGLICDKTYIGIRRRDKMGTLRNIGILCYLAAVIHPNTQLISTYFNKGKCQRKNPPCKYLHPPQHLKEQLVQNGRKNLIVKSMQLHLMQQQFIGNPQLGSGLQNVNPLSLLSSTSNLLELQGINGLDMTRVSAIVVKVTCAYKIKSTP
ncbi:Muscleblind-like protein 3 [Cichlidogyrus casuarinus]|uniref:Muscleblind-like protein 3 n=1 Tax=Cichlidogyrus casuarinus TaxID=1844966 RepID=A0ABD2PXD8_9PLAT